MTTDTVQDVISRFQKHPDDRGSTPVQVARLTGRIAELTEHLREHPKDNHSRIGLLRMVGKRRRLLKHMSDTDPETYRELTAALGLRA